jgi:hypothetical protein
MAAPLRTPSPSAPPPPPAARTAAATRRPRLLWRALATALLGLLAAGALLAALIGWVIATSSGMNSVIALANRFAPVEIEARGSFGALTGEFGFAELRVSAGTHGRQRHGGAGAAASRTMETAAARLRAPERRQPACCGDRRRRRAFDAGAEHRPAAAPFRGARLTLGMLTIAVDTAEFSLQSLAGRVAAGPEGYRVDEGRLAHDTQAADFAFELGGERPFPLQATAQLQARLQDKAIGATLRARGSLVEITVEGELSGTCAGHGVASIASFDGQRCDRCGRSGRRQSARLASGAPSGRPGDQGELNPTRRWTSVAGSLSMSTARPA